MTKQTEALRMAIEVLNSVIHWGDATTVDIDKTVQACKEALADYKDGNCCTEGCIKCDARKVLAETQAPVGYVDEIIKTQHWLCLDGQMVVAQLYATPPSREWQSLSGDEFVAIAKSIWGDNLGMGDGYGYTVAWASSYATIEPSSKMLLLLQKIDKALREKNG